MQLYQPLSSTYISSVTLLYTRSFFAYIERLLRFLFVSFAQALSALLKISLSSFERYLKQSQIVRSQLYIGKITPPKSSVVLPKSTTLSEYSKISEQEHPHSVLFLA